MTPERRVTNLQDSDNDPWEEGNYGVFIHPPSSPVQDTTVQCYPMLEIPFKQRPKIKMTIVRKNGQYNVRMQ